MTDKTQEIPAAASQSYVTDDTDEEISFLDLLIVVAKYKWLVLGLPLLVAIATAGYSLTLPNIYTATTKLLPPQQSQSASAAISAQLSAFAGLLGGRGGAAGPSDLYIAMLTSRTLADRMIRRFGLMQRWKINGKYPSDVYKVLTGVTNITSPKNGIISIEVDDEDPKFAAELANAYVDELLNFTNVLAVTEASQRRLFYERQFALAKENLAKAEAAARQALQTSGLVKVDDQGRAMVEATARLRGQIAAKEVQIGAMQTFAADRNSDLQLAQRELESMKRQLAKIEGVGLANTPTSSPNGQGHSLRLLRDVKYHEVLFEQLARQYELAKIDEAKDSSIIQVMDKAVEPDRKSKPKRAQMVVVSALATGFLVLIFAFLREAMGKVATNPRQMERLRAIKRNFSWNKKL